MKDSFLINVDFFRIGRVYNIVFFRFDKTTKNRNLLFIVNFTITIKFCTLSCLELAHSFLLLIYVKLSQMNGYKLLKKELFNRAWSDDKLLFSVCACIYIILLCVRTVKKVRSRQISMFKIYWKIFLIFSFSWSTNH